MFSIKKILIPIDFSDYSKKALKYAVELNRQFNAELILIYVVEPVIYPVDLNFGQAALPYIEDELRESGEAQLKTLVKKEIPEGIKTQAITRRGKPFVEIIKTAREENCDLIISASHGHSGIEHILFGSTAEKVVRKAPCPVLSIKDSERNFTMP